MRNGIKYILGDRDIELYHGSGKEFNDEMWYMIKENPGRSDENLDCGKGLYLTTEKVQGLNFITKYMKNGPNPPVVMTFEVNMCKMLEEGLTVKYLEYRDEQWMDFTYACRKYGRLSAQAKKCMRDIWGTDEIDVVITPVLRMIKSSGIEDFKKYMRKKEYDKVRENLDETVMDQIVFYTKKGMSYLDFKKDKTAIVKLVDCDKIHEEAELELRSLSKSNNFAKIK